MSVGTVSWRTRAAKGEVGGRCAPRAEIQCRLRRRGDLERLYTRSLRRHTSSFKVILRRLYSVGITSGKFLRCEGSRLRFYRNATISGRLHLVHPYSSVLEVFVHLRVVRSITSSRGVDHFAIWCTLCEYLYTVANVY